MQPVIDPDTLDQLALSLVPGLGPRLTAALIAHFGSAAAVRRASASELRQVPHIGSKLSQSFATALQSGDLDAELASLAKHGVRVAALGTPDYPSAIATLPDAPPLLFLRGEIRPSDARAIAIVGSRECTSYGRRVAEKLASGLARAGVTVISGLARGIDGVAHDAALKAGGRTIAVLAGGLSRIYPPEHADLADRVAAAGALVTETSMRQSPQPGMFPARNRLISGLSIAVVIIEAHERSGALITARHAAEQGREVFAVPGPIDSDASAGCLKLIRDGARLVQSVDDLLTELKVSPLAPPPEVAAGPALTGHDLTIWTLLAERPRHFDEIAQGTGLSVPELSRALMMLEMKRVVKRLPGNLFERR